MMLRFLAALRGVVFGVIIVAGVMGPVPVLAQITPAQPTNNGNYTTMIVTSTLKLGTGSPTANIPLYAQYSINGQMQAQFENTNTGSGAYTNVLVKSGTVSLYVGASNNNFPTSPPGAGGTRAWLDDPTTGSGIDYSASAAVGNHIFYTTGYMASNQRVLIDVNGLTLKNNSALIETTGSSLAVANVGANSCGTTTATIAGAPLAFVITVGATSGSQCRVTFPTAATTEYDCTANDNTTTVAVRTTPVDSTHTDFLGSFTAGDKVTGICVAR